MDRFTKKLEDDSYVVAAAPVSENGERPPIVETAEGFTGEAIDRLAGFENAYELLEKQVEEISRKVEALKAQNKIRSAQGQQLVAQKITYSSMFNLFDV